MSKVSDIIFAGAKHKITSPYGPRNGGYHYGTDYGTYLQNLPQYAIEDGEVYSKGYEPNAAGYYIWVKYPRINKRFLHCHLQKPVTLNKGDKVQRGTLLGYTGTTGNSTGIHLHLGVRDLTTNAYEDPEKFAETYTDPTSYAPLSDEPVRMVMGFASKGDVKSIEALLQVKAIPYTTLDGFVTTDIAVSRGDQIGLVQLCATLGVPCLIYEEEEEAPADTAELEKQLAEANERIKELETDKTVLENRVALRDAEIAALKERIDKAVGILTE